MGCSARAVEPVAPPPPPPAEEVYPHHGETGFVCRDAKLGRFVGRMHSAATVAEARAAAGARTVRVVRPDEAVTQDLRRDRLNIYVDGQRRLIRLRCW